MFQDDLLNGTEGLAQARETNNKVNCLMKDRGLTLNKDKSVFMILGSKKKKKAIQEEVKANPLMYAKKGYAELEHALQNVGYEIY